MRTFIASLLSLTAVLGAAATAQPAAALQLSAGPQVNYKPVSSVPLREREGKELSGPKGYDPLAGPGWGTGGGTKRFPAGQTGIPVNSFRIH